MAVVRSLNHCLLAAAFFIGGTACSAGRRPSSPLPTAVKATESASLATNGDVLVDPDCSLEHRDGCFHIGTYNAGLAVGVIPYASQRNPKIAQALSTQPLDLLCVQEFWLDDHWDELVAAAGDRLPNVYRLPAAAPEQEGLCTDDEVAPLRQCVSRHCPGLRADALARCTVKSCASTAKRMSQPCVSCIVKNPTSSVEEILAACLPTKGSPSVAAPKPKIDRSRHGMEGVLAYGGSYGIGLLTRATILERDSIKFEASLNPRAAIYVRVKTDQISDMHVFCTHLTSVMSNVPYPGRGSWAEEQSREVDQLLAFIDQKARGPTPTVLVGDLNCGPALGSSIHPSQPALYARLLGAGFVDPYAAQDNAECTFCNDALLNGGTSPTGSLIDHVLLRSFPGQARGRRMLRENVVVDADGRAVKTSLSDHYGLMLSLVPARRL